MPKVQFNKHHPHLLQWYCEGCEHTHYINVAPENAPPSTFMTATKWSFNGDLEKPTVSPSVVNFTGHYVSGQPQPPNCRHCNDSELEGCPTSCKRCHIFIRDGMVEFLSDCTHKLAGQIRPLKDIENSED